MKLSKYGITLARLREEDTELVRQWRNSPQITQFMEYREYITPEMQQDWFKSIDNFDNFYFVIEYEGKKIGLINSSKIEWDTVSSEGGIFLWDEQYYETFVPFGLPCACWNLHFLSWGPKNRSSRPCATTKGLRNSTRTWAMS